MERKPDYHSPETIWPPGFSSLRLSLKPGIMHVVHGGQGSPLTLMHGLGGCAQDFCYLAPRLAQQFSLIIPDLIGFGRSSKPEAAYSLAWHAEFLSAMAKELGMKKAAWLGHSLGGLLTLRLGACHPDLASRLIAVCPAGGQEKAHPYQRFLMKALVRPGDRLIFWRPFLVRLCMRQIFADPHIPEARELAERLIRQWRGTDRPALERSLIRTARHILEDPIWPLAGRVKAPVLIIAGKYDRIVPRPDIQRLLDHLPAARLHLLDCGHMPLFSRPADLARLVCEFLCDIF